MYQTTEYQSCPSSRYLYAEEREREREKKKKPLLEKVNMYVFEARKHGRKRGMPVSERFKC